MCNGTLLFFMGRRGELRINDNFLETKIRATPYKNIKKSLIIYLTTIETMFRGNQYSCRDEDYLNQQHKQLYLTTFPLGNNTPQRRGDERNDNIDNFRGNQYPCRDEDYLYQQLKQHKPTTFRSQQHSERQGR